MATDSLFCGVWDYKSNLKKPWLIPMRDINAALKAIGFNPKQRHKQNVSLLFSLAQWGQRHGQIPKMALKKYLDCGDLFDTLQLHKQISPEP